MSLPLFTKFRETVLKELKLLSKEMTRIIKLSLLCMCSDVWHCGITSTCMCRKMHTIRITMMIITITIMIMIIIIIIMLKQPPVEILQSITGHLLPYF